MVEDFEITCSNRVVPLLSPRDNAPSAAALIDEDAVKAHILSINLTISHCDRRHAPFTMYLDLDLDVKDMTRD